MLKVALQVSKVENIGTIILPISGKMRKFTPKFKTDEIC